MDPQLEFFLEDAFKRVQPTSPQIGRVVIEPDYEAGPDAKDRDRLTAELVQCIQEHSPHPSELASPQGWELKIPNKYPLLRKYVRSITLHQAPTERPWVEVAPPGNWI
jgi:hypothetical protein